MASDPQDSEDQFEGEAWEAEEEEYGASNEYQHSDQEHQDPEEFPDAQDSNGDQQQEHNQDQEQDPKQEQESEQEQEQELEELEEDDDESGEDESDEDAGEAEYDPESVDMTPPVPHISEPEQQSEAQPAPQAAPVVERAPSAQPAKTAKPKKSGGFLVGDSDDEDDEPSQVNVPPPRAQEPTTSQASPAQALASAQEERAPSTAPVIVAQEAAPSISTQPVQPVQAAEANSVASVLEARTQNDPRGDMDAWLTLMGECRRANQLDQLRQTYERFLNVFPQSAEVWVEWIKLELDCMNTTAAESLFQRSLLNVPDVQLWTTYINYIRRRNDLNNDPNGQARQVISQSYEFVIDNVGMDRDSGPLWRDWIQFIKSGPGQVGGAGWQDQQKMDQLRKAYHRAIAIPMSALTDLWKDYDQFELGLNKATGRQFIQKRSPGYMTAKSASLQLERKIGKLQRTTLPRLPPMPGFAGDQEFMEQVDLWKQWIQWEKEDPLVLKDDEPEAYKSRVLYVYRQALMALRFWPELWVDAAEWCYSNNVFKDGTEYGTKFLTDGIEANPESVLLAFKHGDRIEMTHPVGDTDESKITRAETVRKPYDRVLDTLYKLMQNLREREKREVAKVEEAAAAEAAAHPSVERNDDDDADDEAPPRTQIQEMVAAVKQGFASQTELLKRTISFVWIALCRVMRRLQGKGSPTAGLRKVFTEARGRGQLTSDVYVAVANIEHVVYKDLAGSKIFDRGAKLFPEDEGFMLEYIKFLHSKDDTTNARVVFETCVNRLTQSPEKKNRAKSLYLYFHKYESQYGELASIAALEKRMAELWPEDAKLSHFSNRHSVDNFDPVAYRLIISPGVQLRSKIMPSIEQALSLRNSPMPPPAPVAALRQTASPAPQYIGAMDSPKRPFPGDDQDDYNRPRKLARGESPLKGAAGRRLDQQRRNNAAPLSRDITFLLGILPPAHSYNSLRFNTSGLVNLVRETNVPDFGAWKASQDQGARQSNGARAASGTHTRQASGGDYASYGGYAGNRDSPNPRPQSPYDGGAGRRVVSQSTYRNSPLRPESGATFESAQAYPQGVPTQWPPAGTPGFDAASGWPQPPAGYGAPPQQQYGQYQF